MTDAITISLDAMSGDHGAAVVVEAAKAALADHADLRLILVGDETELGSLLGQSHNFGDRLSLHHSDEVVTMEDSARDAIRKKKRSSMRLAIDLVKSGEASACVSAGNTGALMATAKFVLKTIPGIDRPAIISEMPTGQGQVFLLDLGANADCSPELLYQFAIMGSVVAHDVTGIDRPRVALLNIGEEHTKGDGTVRAAAELIKADASINYVGFVEGNDIFRSKADVIVTDGFTGNVALKTMEGTAGLFAGYLRREFSRGFISRLQAFIAGGVLRRFKAKIDPRNYNGATLIGLNGIVIKSHGGADAKAFMHAIETALLEVRVGVSNHIGQQLDRS